MIFMKINEVFKLFCCLVLLLVVLTGNLCIVHGADRYKGQWYTNKTYKDTSKSLQQTNYHLYLPEGYDESIAYPLVIFLSHHGQYPSSLSSDPNRHKYIDSALLENGNDKKYPCIILFPGIPDKYYWVDNYFGEISAAMDLTMSLIDTLCQEYSIDQRKIYLTGSCQSAPGAWDALFRFPQKFAAGIPVAGIGPISLAYKIADLPVWFFNSDTDPLLPVKQSRAMAEALKAAGSTKYRYTEYRGYDHVKASLDPWQEKDIFPWMFSQTNPHAPFPEGKTPVELGREDLVVENPDQEQVIVYEPEDGEDEPIKTDDPVSTTQPEGSTNEPEISVVPLKDPVASQKSSSLWMVIVLIIIFVCLSIVFLLFYKKIVSGRKKS